MARAERKEHLYDLLQEFDTAMLVTRSGGGAMHARPMAVAELQPDGDAYFVTGIDSPKIAEIEAEPDVMLTFQGGRRFAALYGRVSVIRDRGLVARLWKEPWKVWFPQGKDDPSICVLKFDAQHGEYWDGAGVQGLKYAFEAAKSYATGGTPKKDEGQHGRLDM